MEGVVRILDLSGRTITLLEAQLAESQARIVELERRLSAAQSKLAEEPE